MVKYLFWKLYLSYLVSTALQLVFILSYIIRQYEYFFSVADDDKFSLILYVVSDLNEIKIMLKEGAVYLFYSLNIHKSRNRNP